MENKNINNKIKTLTVPRGYQMNPSLEAIISSKCYNIY